MRTGSDVCTGSEDTCGGGAAVLVLRARAVSVTDALATDALATGALATDALATDALATDAP
ncbi:MAG: AhpC-related (seleno)protein, partial [Actinomycetota bacterium]|nr:AhpC-related (seleno)protein [Actinomycetota bacterium]